MTTLENKIAVITGGGGGIGSEIGRHLSALGATVVITHLGESDLDYAQRALDSFTGSGHLKVQASVDSYEDNKRLAATLEEQFGQAWRNYAARTGRFFPRFRSISSGSGRS